MLLRWLLKIINDNILMKQHNKTLLEERNPVRQVMIKVDNMILHLDFPCVIHGA